MDLLDKIADYFDVDVVDLYLTQAQQESMLKGFKKGLAQSSNDTTIAAHFGGDEYTEEELEEIRKFAEFIKSKRKDTEEYSTPIALSKIQPTQDCVRYL